MLEKAKANAIKLGFDNVEFRQGDIENIPVSANVAEEKAINIPHNISKKYLTEKELINFEEGSTGIFSVIVYAENLHLNSLI